ncbi:regulatory GntR family protein [Actinocorallia herbida]|uniref:Regulatory GntR family protein n=1 Tax=Actinocorallia herbida TaxID=58109 RepID=A0A3N1CZE5_9ACTN|nr:winged helix-turn-helix domain-containing protein [Actinocorallia herbida]ROO86637.1 regulatory GntR family protein [Actinocorallia herbida]
MSSTARGASSQIAESLKHRVTDGVYAPGTKLPSESALCAEFGVTRNTMRRALSALEKAGLVVTIPGTGRTVRDPDGPTRPSPP